MRTRERSSITAAGTFVLFVIALLIATPPREIVHAQSPTWSYATSPNIHYSGGNVGIGTNSVNAANLFTINQPSNIPGTALGVTTNYPFAVHNQGTVNFSGNCLPR